jgi:phosphatidylinositol alpha-1,6-mannosyltransferase
MRLLLVTKDFPPHVGGIQTWSAELGQRFASRCDDFALIAPRVSGQAEVDRALPFEVIRVPCTPGTFAGVVSLGLGALCRSGRFDTLLGAQWQSSVPGVLWRKRGGPGRVFAAVHGREILIRHYRSWPLAPALYAGARERVLDQLDGVFPVSSYARDLVAHIGARTNHALVVTNGCNAERFQPGPVPELARELGLRGRRVLLSVGRLIPRKGVDTVLHALSALGVRYPDLRYVIAGDGPERGRLELLAERLRISHKVRFLGEVEPLQLPYVYHLCDIFVHAARQDQADVEGFGLVLLEASASGKPVVATCSGGVADAVLHGQTGLLSQPEDSSALARNIMRLLEDGGLAQRLGAAGRSHVLARATWDSVAERLLQAMSGLPGASARPRREHEPLN